MRISELILPCSLLFCLGLQAQDKPTSAEQAEQARALMEQYMKQAGINVEEDDTPFEPLGMTGSFTMEVHMYKDDKPQKNSPMTIRYSFDNEHIAMMPIGMMEGKDVQRFIYDLKARKYVILMEQDGKKTGMTMRMMKVNTEKMDAMSDPSEMNITRTGNTKDIDGRTCYEYSGEDDEGKWIGWIDEGMDVQMHKISAAITSGSKIENWQQMPFKNGMMMECIYTNKTNNEKMEMFAKDVTIGRVDQSLFETDGYEILDMTSFPGMGK